MEKNEVSTRLRLSIDLHAKLKILADIDNRSLHSFIINILEQHVIEFEKNLLNKYGFDGFEEAYDTIFGLFESHLFVNEADFEMQAKLDRIRKAKKEPLTDE